jgi:hypothetical protein
VIVGSGPQAQAPETERQSRSRLFTGSTIMPTYRVHKFSPAGQLSGVPELVDCADDQEAIRKAQHAVDGMDIELWIGTRLVASLPRNQ